jgi:hypothetical protein
MLLRVKLVVLTVGSKAYRENIFESNEEEWSGRADDFRTFVALQRPERQL